MSVFALLIAAAAPSAPEPAPPEVRPLPLEYVAEAPRAPAPVGLHAQVKRLDWSEFERGRCAEARFGAEWRAHERVALSAAVRARRGSSLAEDDAGWMTGLRVRF